MELVVEFLQLAILLLSWSLRNVRENEGKIVGGDLVVWSSRQNHDRPFRLEEHIGITQR